MSLSISASSEVAAFRNRVLDVLQAGAHKSLGKTIVTLLLELRHISNDDKVPDAVVALHEISRLVSKLKDKGEISPEDAADLTKRAEKCASLLVS